MLILKPIEMFLHNFCTAARCVIFSFGYSYLDLNILKLNFK